MTATSVSASAKIILCGEHAVVYGQPAIAVPLSDLRTRVQIAPGSEGLTVNLTDTDEVLPDIRADHPVSQMIRLLLDTCGTPEPAATLTVRSDIPVARGMGSGAALSTAIGHALLTLVDCQMSRHKLNEMVYNIEKIYHGTPSGIDNTTIVYEQPVYFVRHQPVETFTMSGTLSLLIADTGMPSLTKAAVGDVRKLYDRDPTRIQPVLEQIGEITQQIRHAMSAGEAHRTGNLMTRNHELLRELTVSSDKLDHLVKVALAAGAKGAKLSGGGRGGNMIALVDESTQMKVERALLAAGAVRVYHTQVSG